VEDTLRRMSWEEDQTKMAAIITVSVSARQCAPNQQAQAC
jgi:hypothetical protein